MKAGSVATSRGCFPLISCVDQKSHMVVTPKALTHVKMAQLSRREGQVRSSGQKGGSGYRREKNN